MSVLNAKLIFEPTEYQPLEKEWDKKRVHKIIESNVPYEKVIITTGNVMNEAKDYLMPELDEDKLILPHGKSNKKVDRNFDKMIGDQIPMTMEELIIRSSPNRYANQDDYIIPTHQDNRQEQVYIQDNQIEEQKKNLGQPEDLSEDQMNRAQHLIPIFGIEIIKKLYSSDWHFREQSLQEIIYEVGLGTKSKISGSVDNERLFTACFQVISECSGDNISQVLIACYDFIKKICKEIFPSITLNVKSELNKHVDSTSTYIINKVGEGNAIVKQNAEDAAIVMCNHPQIGPNAVINQIVKGYVKSRAKNSVKHIVGRMNLLNKVLHNFKIDKHNIDYQSCIEYAVENLKNSNAGVRNQSYVTILEIYMQIGRKVVDYLEDLRQNQLDIIEKAFAEIDQGNIEQAYNTVQNTSVHQSQQIKSTPSVQQSNNQIQQQQEQKQSKDSKQDSKKDSKKDLPSCQFCQLKNPDFDNDEVLDLHYFQECKYLSQCQYCEQIIEIPSLLQHWLEECEHKTQLRQCQTCQIVLHENQFEQHTIDKKCTKPKKNEVKCPLCDQKIPEVKKSFFGKKSINQGWIQHLVVEGCPKNLRA